MKQKIKKIVQGIKDTGKALLYTSPFWLPQVIEAKPLDLQTTKTAVTQDYMHGAYLKASKAGNSFYAGMNSELGNGFYFDTGISNSGLNGAVLGKNLGIEVSTDLKGKKSLALDAMVAGTGFTVKGDMDSEGNTTFSGTAFRAEQIGEGTYYGKVDFSKDDVSLSGLGFYMGPKIGETTIVPLAMASKSLSSENHFVMAGAVALNGKVSVSGTISTTDFEDFSPSLKVAYKF